MKLAKYVAVLLVTVLSGMALAQARFSHIVMIVQENRTPDNLFAACNIAGADTVLSGNAISLGHTYDLSHSHPQYLRNAAGSWPPKAHAYVLASDVKPYCQLAGQYGFANRMFQTNQGSSFPAHQFIFGGTSAPNATSDLFIVGDTKGGVGCLESGTVDVINPSGKISVWPTSCLERPTLTDELDTAGLTWRYYISSVDKGWDAPVAISHICKAEQGECTGADWRNVSLPPQQVLTDIAKCNLANVVWVTPAGVYSDHPGLGNGGGGPAWVASIVNAIGSASACPDGEVYWQNTAILVIWDDWGGWYDHVAPLANNTGWCISNCYGFRVPLLAISAFTPTMVDDQPHDFGSMLRFVESNFGLSLIGPGTWADSYADDLSNFFPAGAARSYTIVKSRKLTRRELASTEPPDND